MRTCIQCQIRRAKWHERRNSNNVYCGRLCQMHYHFVGLRGYADDIVGLEASDGTRIRITADEARQMKTIEYLLEDVGTEEYIPLPSIAGRTLLQIKAFVSDRPAFVIDTDEDVLDLLKAANYLDFQSLIYHLMPMWVNNPDIFPGPPELRGHVREALYFFIGNDFTVLNLDRNLTEPFKKFRDRMGRLQWNIRKAAQEGRLAVVERLLQFNWVDPAANGNYAIRTAAQEGHWQVVARLLQDDRVDPAAEESYTIRMAASNDHLQTLQLLLQDGRADPSADKNYAIRIAAQNGHLKVVERLLQDDRVDPSANSNDAIGSAAREGHVKVVDILLQDDRVDPTADDNYAIAIAASFGHLKVVERLLQDNRVDPSTPNNFALRVVALSGHFKVVELLLQDNRVDPAADNNAALRWAAEKGHFEVVELLLQDDRVDPEILKGMDTPELRVLYEKYSRKRQRV